MKKALFSILILLASVCNAQTIVEKSMKSKILGCEKTTAYICPQGMKKETYSSPFYICCTASPIITQHGATEVM